LYGIIVAIPSVIIAGPIFSRTLKKIDSKPLDIFKPSTLPDEQLPGLMNSIISSLLPVGLIAITTLLRPVMPTEGSLAATLTFVSDPDIVMLISLLVATFTLGINMKMNMSKIMSIYSDAVKDVAMVLLII